jgi:fibronectin-binding autotransporter adhesin
VGDGGSSALTFGTYGQGAPKAEFSLSTSTTAGGGVNDLVAVNGDFGGSGARVYINPLSPLTVGTPYTLITVTGAGANSGVFSSTVNVVPALQPSRYTFSLDQGSTDSHKILLTVTAGAGNLVWNNAASTGIWDTNNSVNWSNTVTLANDKFLQLDSVTFNDSIGNGVTAINVGVTNLQPGIVTVNSGTNYTFYGLGSIGGSASLVKQGSGTLTISNANSFTGTVTVQGGTLAANVNNALGSASAIRVYGGALQINAVNSLIGPVLVTNGMLLMNAVGGLGDTNSNPIYITNSGTLDVGGPSFGANQNPIFGTQPIYVSGWGVNSNGCVINSSTNLAQENAFENLTLTGDAAIGGNSRWDIGRPTVGSGVLSTGGNPYNLYKVGTNYVAFLGLTVDTNLANIDIRSGTLAFQQAESSMGNPSSNITVEAGATLEFYNSTTNMQNLTKQFVLDGDGVTANITNENGVTTINGNMTLSGNCIIGVGGTTLSNNCVISGSGSLTKNASAVLVLSTNETYTGNTTVSAGTLSLVGTATINNSTNINILGGTVDVTGLTSDYTLTLNADSLQTLSGSGTIAGNLDSPAGTTVSINTATTNTVGELTVMTNATLGGTINMELDPVNNTNDMMVVGGMVTYGGTLYVTNISDFSLSPGQHQTFKLFNASTYNGSFSDIQLPTIAGISWDTSQIGNNGTITANSTLTPTPIITNISLNGTQLTINASNGPTSGTFALLESTNVALPLSQWTPVFTNNFDGSGDLVNFQTNVVDPSQPQTFYILQVLP